MEGLKYILPTSYTYLTYLVESDAPDKTCYFLQRITINQRVQTWPICLSLKHGFQRRLIIW